MINRKRLIHRLSESIIIFTFLKINSIFSALLKLKIRLKCFGFFYFHSVFACHNALLIPVIPPYCLNSFGVIPDWPANFSANWFNRSFCLHLFLSLSMESSRDSTPLLPSEPTSGA